MSGAQQTYLWTRTRAVLEERGYVLAKTEYWLSLPGGHGVRKDLFGLADGIALRYGERVLFQITTSSHVADRRRKIEAQEYAYLSRNSEQRVEPILPIVLRAGLRFVVFGWRQRKSGRWELWREEEAVLREDGVIEWKELTPADWREKKGNLFAEVKNG